MVSPYNILSVHAACTISNKLRGMYWHKECRRVEDGWLSGTKIGVGRGLGLLSGDRVWVFFGGGSKARESAALANSCNAPN